MHVDQHYQELVQEILNNGVRKPSRAGDTISIFDHTMKFDLREGFPLLTTKRITFSNIYTELMWFIRGDSNIKQMRAPQLWEAWADKDGNCGRIYGVQWRDWLAVNKDDAAYLTASNIHTDQLKTLIKTLKTNPSDRRMIVTAWNPGELAQMALPPCHMFFQCYVSNGHLDLSMWQRSCDTAIGVPYNIASYALLLMLLAKEANLIPRFFNHHLGDAHIYEHHVSGLEKQLQRKPWPAMPTLELLGDMDIFERATRDNDSDYALKNYTPAAFIKFALNV